MFDKKLGIIFYLNNPPTEFVAISPVDEYLWGRNPEDLRKFISLDRAETWKKGMGIEVPEKETK